MSLEGQNKSNLQKLKSTYQEEQQQGKQVCTFVTVEFYNITGFVVIQYSRGLLQQNVFTLN